MMNINTMFTACTNLQKLNIDGCFYTQLIIDDCVNLTSLSRENDPFLPNLTYCTKLKFLKLGAYKGISTLNIPHVSPCTDLRRLVLGKCDAELDLSTCTKLESLILNTYSTIPAVIIGNPDALYYFRAKVDQPYVDISSCPHLVSDV